MRSVKLILIYSLILFACRNNNVIEDIKVTGTVIDFETKQPIANVQVMILCWKEAELESGDVDYVKKETYTDENGMFDFTFRKGFKLDIGTVRAGFQPNHSKIDAIKKDMNIHVKLKKSDFKNSRSQCPGKVNMFVAARTYYMKADTVNELIGLDLTTGLNTTDLTEADLWIEAKNKSKGILNLMTSTKKGLLAFRNKTVEDTVQVAPNEGYQSEYLIQGDEKGFWVKLKDNEGYAKVLVVDRFDKSSPYKNGYFKEVGMVFQCEYFLGNFESVQNQFDLEEFLLKGL
jgi:hypothetical protein